MERWAAVLGYEGMYEVSNKGRVRSLPRIRTNGGVLRKRFLRIRIYGYAVVGLNRGNAGKTFGVHRLVWEAFRGKIPDGLEINHKNGIKHDNRLCNLEAVTHAENIHHAIDVLGFRMNPNPAKGERNGGGGKLTEHAVREIRRQYQPGMGKRLAMVYDVSDVMILNIVRGKSWSHVK